MPDIEGGFAPSSMNFNADATAIGCSLAHSSASPSSGRSRLCLSEPSCSSFWLSCYSEALAGSEAALSTELATTVAAGSASYSLSCWSWFCSEGFELLLSHRPIGRTLSPPVARSGHRMSAKPCLLSGVKRTPNARPVAAANDPKRTFMVTKTSGQGRPPQAFRRTALL